MLEIKRFFYNFDGDLFGVDEENMFVQIYSVRVDYLNRDSLSIDDYDFVEELEKKELQNVTN